MSILSSRRLIHQPFTRLSLFGHDLQDVDLYAALRIRSSQRTLSYHEALLNYNSHDTRPDILNIRRQPYTEWLIVHVTKAEWTSFAKRNSVYGATPSFVTFFQDDSKPLWYAFLSPTNALLSEGPMPQWEQPHKQAHGWQDLAPGDRGRMWREEND